MIKSRRPTEPSDEKKCCANCIFLRYISDIYQCRLDGQPVPEKGFISITICNKWKEANDGKL